MEALTVNTDTQEIEVAKANIEAIHTHNCLTPLEDKVVVRKVVSKTEQENIELNRLASDAAIELGISKSELKTIIQKEKIKSELKDDHYYVNVDEVHNYLTKSKALETVDKEVRSSMDKAISTKDLAPMESYVITKTEEEKAEFVKKFNLNIKDIDGKLKRISSKKPVNSPFNYTGNKEELFPQILPYFKPKIATFYDVFGGGGIVGLNVEAQDVIYNELDKNLCDVVENLSKNTVEENYQVVLDVIEKYNLNIDNKEAYIQLREAYNASNDKPWSMFYVLMIFSYQNNISYAKKDKEHKKFNKGFGDRDFNNSLRNKFLLFTDKLIANVHRMHFQYGCYSFINTHKFNKGDFVYLDPAYFLTAYKYGIEWGKEEEKALLKSLDSLNERNVNFALSNVVHHNGETNHILIDWAEKNEDYNVINLNKSYADQCSLETEGRTSVEVLITNYKTLNSKEVHEVTMMDTEIVQGRFVKNSIFDVNNEVQNIKKHFKLSEVADKNFLLSMKQAIKQRCIGLVNKVKVGQELIIFQEKCFAEDKTYKDEFNKQDFGFSLKTGGDYMKLARDERILKLTVEDITDFPRKSLDALKDMTYLTDEEFDLFLEGRHEVLKARRAIAKSRQKPSIEQNNTTELEDTLNIPESVETVAEVANGATESEAVTEKEFLTPSAPSDERKKEIDSLDLDEARKQLLRLESAEYLILNLHSSVNNTFPFIQAS